MTTKWKVEIRHDGQLYLMAPIGLEEDGSMTELPVEYCQTGNAEDRERECQAWEDLLNDKEDNPDL